MDVSEMSFSKIDDFKVRFHHADDVECGASRRT